MVTATISAATDAEVKPDPETIKGIFSAGVDVGTPTGINLRAGYFHNYFALIAGGGYWTNQNYGVEATAAFNFLSGVNFYQGIGITGGYFSNNPLLSGSSGFVFATGNTAPQNYTYLGPQYTLYVSGFTLAAGLGFGSGSYALTQFIFRFGYLFRIF